MRVLVTGGAGFIGSHLVDELVATGYTVRVLDNFSTGTRANLAHVAEDVEIISGDIRDREVCRRACEDGITHVWHLAALASVPLSIEDPVATHDVNVTGTLNMLLAARDAGVQRLVFSSSCAVYGANPHFPREEGLLPLPVSPYAASKLAAEYYVRQFPDLYGLETVALRYFNIYGPRQDPNGPYAAVVPKFLQALLRGEPPVIFGDGEQSRDFVYVMDCVHANLLAGFTNGSGIVGDCFNVAVGYTVTINTLLATIQESLGVNIPARHAPPRPGDLRYSDGLNTRLVQRLGFKPQWTLEAGIHETAAWYR